MPFQFSLHLEETDGTITHHEFLHTEGTDPRIACAAALAACIPSEATVIGYNASFERSAGRPCGLLYRPARLVFNQGRGADHDRS